MSEKNKQTENKPAESKSAARKEYEVKVTTHVHKGVPCHVGDKIDLTAAQAERLKKKGVI